MKIIKNKDDRSFDFINTAFSCKIGDIFHDFISLIYQFSLQSLEVKSFFCLSIFAENKITTK